MDHHPHVVLATFFLFAATAVGQVVSDPAELPVPTPTDSQVDSPTAKVDASGAIELRAEPTPAADADPVGAVAEAEAIPGSESAVQELQGSPIESGPIHEAFAEPLELTPKPTKVLKKAPPANIEELPPTTKPTSSRVKWIPGYWAWDAQRDDYVWVSGVWRRSPVGRVWVAGRWEHVEGGYQWVSGSWMKADEDGELAEQESAPLPPDSLEEGPTGPAPSDDHFWIPGVWKLNEAGEYAWRPGFWSKTYENWVWVPDHHLWNPTGCTFVAGYWDYPWERRGTLYAPCSFGSADLTGRVCYRPSQVIDTNQWLVNLWVSPGYGHYYYGDYYGRGRLGYQPWYSYYGSNRRCYDPFYSYYRWRFPTTYGIGLYGYLHNLHSHYARNPLSRPRVSLYGYNDWSRRPGRYGSLYGNVRDLHGRHGHSRIHDHLGYGRSRYYDDHYRDRSRQQDLLRALSRQRTRQSQPQRRLLGYANGQAVYSDRGRSGVITRGDIGTRGAPGITRSEIGTGRSRGRSSNRDNLDRMRELMERRVPAVHQTTGPRHRNPSVSRPGRSSTVRRPEPRVTTARPGRSNPPITRSPRPQNQLPSMSRRKVQATPPARQVTRATPRPTRPAPAARASNPGFTTHGMRKARGADLARQRANMLKTMQNRKGK